MNKAVFLDRDGVINKERRDYVKKLNEFEINENIFEVIREIKKRGFLIIIITNQSAVNRKLMKEEELLKIHNFFIQEVKKNGGMIDAIYYCPHRPDENCMCRKPKPGLILQAVRDFDIDLGQSLMIGDSKKDIQAAKIVNCKGILLGKDESLLQKLENFWLRN